MRFDRHQLGDIFSDLFQGLLDLGDTALRDVVDKAVARVDLFLSEHADSPNFLELADHAATQIIQETGLAALRLDREATARVRASIIAVLRALIVTAVA